MGRQIQLHMFGGDCEELLTFMRMRDPIVITARDATAADVEEALSPSQGGLFTLWNQALLPSLKRTYIEDAQNGPYYRIDCDRLPVLELFVTVPTEWNNRPALTQGRIYTGFNWKKGAAFEKWHEAVFRWIRKNFIRNPVPFLQGYIGREAFAWYSEGGVLLPMIRPPLTPEWLAFLNTQDEMRPALKR